MNNNKRLEKQQARDSIKLKMHLAHLRVKDVAAAFDRSPSYISGILGGTLHASMSRLIEVNECVDELVKEREEHLARFSVPLKTKQEER